jgi:hypothetical protein
MTDDEIFNLMRQFTNNYPDWIKAGIGSHLAEMNKHLTKIEKNTRKAEDKSRDDTSKSIEKLNKTLSTNQKHQKRKIDDDNKIHAKQIKSTTEVTKITQEQLRILRETVSNMRSYDKSLEKSTDTIEDETEAREGNTDAIEDNTKRFDGLTKTVDFARKSMRDMHFAMKHMPGLLQSRQYGSAVSNFTESLSNAIPKVNLFTKSIGAIVFAAGQYLGVLVDHASKLQASFSTLNQAGIFVRDGMFEIQRTAAKAGMSLEQFTTLVGKTQDAVLKMGPDGLDTVARLNKEMNYTTSIFRRMGMRNEEIMEFQAETLKHETTIGRFKRLNEDQQRVRMEATLIRLAGLTSIMGKSMSEIREGAAGLLTSPDVEALIMQAMRGTTQDERSEFRSQLDTRLKGVVALDMPQQLQDQIASIIVANMARQQGRDVVAPRVTEAMVKLETFAPGIIGMVDTISDASSRVEVAKKEAEDGYKKTADLEKQLQNELERESEKFKEAKLRGDKVSMQAAEDRITEINSELDAEVNSIRSAIYKEYSIISSEMNAIILSEGKRLYEQLSDDQIAALAREGGFGDFFDPLIAFASAIDRRGDTGIMSQEDFFKSIDAEGSNIIDATNNLDRLTNMAASALESFNTEMLRAGDEGKIIESFNNALEKSTEYLS